MITRHLSRLQTLRLDFNRLSAPGSEEDPGRHMLDVLTQSEGFRQVRELTLNGTRIDWPHVCHLSQYLRSLERLELNRNCLNSIESSLASSAVSLPLFGCLQDLDLSNNSLQDWRSVAEALCKLPELAKLNLADNKLAIISARDCSRQQEGFRRLASINLSGNPLLDLRGTSNLRIKLDMVWSSLYALDLWLVHSERTDQGVRGLNAFPAQDDTEAELGYSDGTVQPCPLQEVVKQWSMNVISRLPNLTILNGTEILARQRREAEDSWLDLMSQRLQGAEKGGQGTDGQALGILIRALEDKEPRWHLLRAGELQSACLASSRQQSQCTNFVLL